ncbi:MAG: LuxR C-terminal-related transcriptional regulator [Solirubrobacterales bacterium]
MSPPLEAASGDSGLEATGTLRAGEQLAGGPAIPPVSGSGLIARPRLVERLVASRSMPLVVLEGPPGYAKTTCLALWDAADDRDFCWVSCQARHNDPSVLVSAIIEALEPVELLDPEILLALSSPTPDLDTVLDRLAVALERIVTPFVLVVDDVHRLTADGTGTVLESVLDSLPARSQLAIGSRARPSLPLGRLRAKRALLEFGPSDLAMTRRESGELLAAIGLDVDSEEIDLIFDRTEGWPAALYLAGLALLSPGSGADGAVEAFGGDDRVVVEYLRDEFFDGMPEEQSQFLYRTSLLEELSGPLCDAVLERNDSAQVLSGLARTNTMVVPLDRTDSLYRYHHLFSDMLQSELRHREPRAENGIHLRASRWYAEHGHLSRAVGHAIASEDTELVGELVWKAFPELSGRGQMATLDRWLDELGEDRIRSSTPLIMTVAHRDLVSGRGGDAVHWADVAIAKAGHDSPYQADIHELKATIGKDGLAKMEEDAIKASEGLDPTSPWQAPCLLFRGVAVQMRGDAETAEPILRDAARRGSIHSPIVQALALAQLTILTADLGRWDEAARFASQAREQVEHCGLANLGTMALVYAASALVRTHQGKVEAAVADVSRSRGLLQKNVDLPLWFEAELRLTLCRANLRLGDSEFAALRLKESTALVDRLPNASVLERWLREVKVGFDDARGTLAGESFDLTKAELRTLQFLPSHHSFRAIGEQLHLSQNTVKTQAGSLYRKLGANSRTEAVMVARKAGLLDPPEGR